MEQLLTFQSEDIDFILANQSAIADWINHVIKIENGTLEFINYVFCSDAYLLNLNLEYLQHDTLTDIITFHYSEESIESDIFISIDRVRENASIHNTTFLNELHRVIIHGILHLLGYGDKSVTDKENMRILETKMLEILSKDFLKI